MKLVLTILFLVIGLLCWALVRGGDCDPDWYDEM